MEALITFFINNLFIYGDKKIPDHAPRAGLICALENTGDHSGDLQQLIIKMNCENKNYRQKVMKFTSYLL